MRRDLRERIAEALDQLPDEQIAELLKGVFEADKTIWVDITCKNDACGKTYRYPVEVPNWMERAKVLDILATQSKGKPAETKTLVVETAVRPVGGMTLAELEAEEARLLQEFPELAAGAEV